MCLTQLTAQAIQNSSEIDAINQRLELTDARINYAEARQWTDYITLDPLRLVQNIFGGGDVQRNRLAIATVQRGYSLNGTIMLLGETSSESSASRSGSGCDRDFVPASRRHRRSKTVFLR